MPTRSQRHLREIQGYDSSGATDLPSGGGNPVTIDPTSASIGDGTITLSVYGTGFTVDSVIQLNGSPQPTNFVSDTEVNMDFNANAMTGAATFNVTVETDGVVTDPAPLEIFDEFDFAPPSLSPSAGTAGASISLDVFLGSFVDGMTTVYVNGVAQTTTFVSNVQLTVNPFVIPTPAGPYDVFVRRGTKDSIVTTFTAT